MTERCICCGQPIPQEQDILEDLKTMPFRCASTEEARRLDRLRLRARIEIEHLRKTRKGKAR